MSPSAAVKFETVDFPKRPFPLITFNTSTAPAECKTMSDADSGGYSTSTLDFIPSRDKDEPDHIRFHGRISTDLPPHRPKVLGTGYAGFRTQDRGVSMFGLGFWDIDPYAALALRVKSDGRRYYVNVQTDSLIPTDLHQHRLYAKRPGEWETVLINFNDFVRTNFGKVAEPQSEIMRRKVKSVGLSLMDRVPGDFGLCIERIWATNGLGGEEEWRRRDQIRERHKIGPLDGDVETTKEQIRI
jgi:NADH dehydrogenase [ubiquinone] 1 alpha subcomplex assembly factor 1